MNLNEAIETAQFWLDVLSDNLADELADNDEHDRGGEEERKAIQAMRIVIAAAQRGIGQ